MSRHKFKVWIPELEEFGDPNQYVMRQDGCLYAVSSYTGWGMMRCDSKRFIPVFSTGLSDKNGVEIFEGDILRIYDTDMDYFLSIKHEVVWGGNSGYPAFDLKPSMDFEYNGLQYVCGISDNLMCGVIGNRFEHPHLLEDAT